MKQIRYSVFETNSSSTHSITILKNGDFDDDWKESYHWDDTDEYSVGSKISDYTEWDGDSNYDKYDYVYHVCYGKFSWQWFILKTFDAKMDYVYTLFKEYEDYNENGYYADEAKKIKETYPDYKKTLTDIIRKHYNNDTLDVEFQKGDDCYIDHSADYIGMILFNGKWSLEEILTNDDIVITGGNDND